MKKLPPQIPEPYYVNLDRYGRIPAGELCPYTIKCPIIHDGKFPGRCKHKGFTSEKPFSCITARALDFNEK